MATKTILLLNGPNLNLTGKRETEVYGTQTLDSYFADLQANYPSILLQYFQTNHEGDIINQLQTLDADVIGVVLNAGALSHYSYAIRDAIAACTKPVIEVHISNIFAREAFRATSVLSPVCRGVISGLGLQGYRLAVESLLSDLA
jgi:3-dehydroquinate dehydratase II